MAYISGSYTDQNDLLDIMVSFLVSSGWTKLHDTTEQPGSWRRLHFNKGDHYVNLRSVTPTSTGTLPRSQTGGGNAIAGYPSDSYSSGSDWLNQPGNTISTRGGYLGDLSVLSRYFGFSYPDSDEVYFVVESAPGVWQMMAFGTVVKYNASDTHGRWMFSTNISKGPLDFSGGTKPEGGPFQGCFVPGEIYDSTEFRYDSGVFNNWSQASSESNGFNSDARRTEYFLRLSGGAVGRRNVLLSTGVYLVSSSIWKPYGYIKYLRRTSMTNLSPAEEIILGPDTWVAFPYWSKGFTHRSIDGCNAIKKVV